MYANKVGNLNGMDKIPEKTPDHISQEITGSQNRPITRG